MSLVRYSAHAIACLAIAATVAPVALAGPLNPPAGPIASTQKPLREIEPRIAINAANTPGDATTIYRITGSGSYYLTANVDGAPGKHGIEILASGVTIDLNGFEVIGGQGANTGIRAFVPNISCIEIHSGSVRGWSGDGISLALSGCQGVTIRNVRAEANSSAGIRVGNGALVTGCNVTSNTVGIVVGSGSTVASCVASSNLGGPGISAQFGCTVTECSSYGNSGAGIVTEAGASVTSCAAYQNGVEGIAVLGGSTVTGCAAQGNASRGILLGDGCTATNNTCRQNGSDGIYVQALSIVSGNTCVQNGAACGIRVTGSDNRIDSNNCNGQNTGIGVNAGGNFITRNVCSGNGINWFVVAGNACLVVNAATCPQITGLQGGVSPGSTDPNANFSY